MQRFSFLITLLMVLNCGLEPAAPQSDDPESEDIEEEGPETPAPAISFSCPEEDAATIVPGDNSDWNAGDVSRQFFAEFPVSMDEPVGVLFSWHGVGDTMENWRGSLPFDPNGDPDFPFIVITPESTQMSPINQPAGIDWDIFESNADDDNREALLFESILGCLASQYNIDTRRIYTGGFSGGALVSAMLYSRYPDLIAGAAVFSGAFLNDPVQVASINTGPVPVTISWDDLAADVTTPIMMSHGGATDTYGVMGIEVINFENTMQQTKTFLGNAGRLIVDCPHTLGHTFPPGLTLADVVDFFKAHPFGATALYGAEGLPATIGSQCSDVTAE